MSRTLVVFILLGIKEGDVFVSRRGLSCGDGACLDTLLDAGLCSSWLLTVATLPMLRKIETGKKSDARKTGVKTKRMTAKTQVVSKLRYSEFE